MISETNSYAECVLDLARTLPERVAFKSASVSYTYAELADEALRHAAILRDLGVKRGDRVAILTTPRAESAMLFIAMNMVGAIWICLNPQYRLREFHYTIDDAKPSLLFYVPSFEGRDYHPDLRQLMADNPCLKQVVCLEGDSDLGLHLADLVAEARAPFAMEEGRDRRFDAATIVYTSGSTGSPKGAVLPNHGLMERGRAYNRNWPSRDYPRVFDFYPLNHVGGLGWVLGYGLVGGGTSYFAPRFDIETYGDTIRREGITALQGPPMLYQMLLSRADFDPADYASVEWLLYSGAAMSEDLLTRIDRLGVQYSPTYGLTEACGGLTFRHPGGQDSVALLARTMGMSLNDGEVRVMTEDGRIAAPGELGEIQIERSRCMLEYFNRPEATAAAFTADGYFRTGDVAEVAERGYLQFRTRKSEMFKSGGYNIYPREIEAVLEEHPKVGLAAVIGLPHALYSEVGLAYVLPASETAAPPSPEELRDWCRARMANYKVPKRFIVERSLPTLGSGKVDKVTLRAKAMAEQQPV